jgi:hypothetical protein
MNEESMNLPDYDPDAIRALLETLQRQQGEGAIPAAEDLLGWLEGTLSAERAAAVEASLARLPELRRALAAARLGREEAMPPAELAKLEGLVIAPVVPFAAEAERTPRWALALAAAAAVALLAPAWSIGSSLAEQRRQAQERELREFLNPGMMRGGL